MEVIALAWMVKGSCGVRGEEWCWKLGAGVGVDSQRGQITWRVFIFSNSPGCPSASADKRVRSGIRRCFFLCVRLDLWTLGLQKASAGPLPVPLILRRSAVIRQCCSLKQRPFLFLSSHALPVDSLPPFYCVHQIMLIKVYKEKNIAPSTSLFY